MLWLLHLVIFDPILELTNKQLVPNIFGLMRSTISIKSLAWNEICLHIKKDIVIKQ